MGRFSLWWPWLCRGLLVSAFGVIATAAGASPAIAADLIYWDNCSSNTIGFANLDGSGGGGVLDISPVTPNCPDGLTIDSATGRIYWASLGTQTIQYANLDGGGAGTLSAPGATFSFPNGPVIDPATRKIYWANSGSNTIEYANLDGSGGGQLDTTGAVVDGPNNVAIDPANGRIYWANGPNNTIYSANLDNTGGGEQLNTGSASIAYPNGIAIDVRTDKLYWANSDNAHPIAWALTDNSGTAANLDTTGAPAAGAYGVALDPAGGKAYWINPGNNSISFANLDGSGGGGQLGTAGTTLDNPDLLVLLKTPRGAGAPVITGGSTTGSTLSCSQGTWESDLVGALLYQAPQTFSYSWTLNGVPIPGATSTSMLASAPGRYACTVTAANHAGTSSQPSAPFTVAAANPIAAPTPVTPSSQATPTNQFTISHVRTSRSGAVRFILKLPGPGIADVLETAWRDNFASVASASLLQPAAGRFVFAREHLTISGAAAIAVTVRPNRRGMRLVAHHRYAVVIRLWVSYTPTGGNRRDRGLHGLHITHPRRRQ